jgi:single-strand DNA-binding protein
MNETLITLQGYVGGEVRIRAAGDSEVATFRVGCTPRRWSRKEQTWSDAATQWYSVTCWRGLARHVERSVRRGDPVVIHGRLSTNVWVNSEGVEVTAYDVEALFVGHDLNRGTSVFTKTPRPVAAAEPMSAAPEEPAPEPTTSAAA